MRWHTLTVPLNRIYGSHKELICRYVRLFEFAELSLVQQCHASNCRAPWQQRQYAPSLGIVCPYRPLLLYFLIPSSILLSSFSPPHVSFAIHSLKMFRSVKDNKTSPLKFVYVFLYGPFAPPVRAVHLRLKPRSCYCQSLLCIRQDLYNKSQPAIRHICSEQAQIHSYRLRRERPRSVVS